METANKKFRYSIRKFKVGVGSVLIATCLLGAGISTQTAFAMTEPSTATEPTKTPLQHLRELVEELKTDLEELEKLEKYEKSAYPTQDYLWTEFSSVGIKEMERVSSLKEEDSQIPDIDPLLDFGNHIKWERLTREVALYRKKYPNNKEIEEEYKQHLEQTEIKTYASQEGFNLKTSTNEAEQAVERIKKIVQELEAKAEEKTPETKEETPVPTPDAAPAPAPTPKEEDAPAPKEDEVPAPMPDAPAPKAEEEVPTPMPDAPAPKEEGIPAPMPDTPMDQPKTDKVESDKQMPEAKQPEMEQPKAEDMPKEEMPKSEQPKAEDSAPKTAVPEVAPKTAEKPKLDFTTKERKVEEALPIKEEIRYDASLPLGKSYLLQEGKAGKKVSVYQDVIVDGKVVVTNLLSETVVEGQNRILVKGSLEMKKEEVKTTPSVQSNPTLSHKGAPSANKATLPATGEQRNNLALVGLGLAGISLAVVATAINKKSKDQI